MIAPASTGKDKRSNRAVMKTAHTNSGRRSIFIPTLRMLITVVMKFTAPRIDETPAKCREKIPRSTEAPA